MKTTLLDKSFVEFPNSLSSDSLDRNFTATIIFGHLSMFSVLLAIALIIYLKYRFQFFFFLLKDYDIKKDNINRD